MTVSTTKCCEEVVVSACWDCIVRRGESAQLVSCADGQDLAAAGGSPWQNSSVSSSEARRENLEWGKVRDGVNVSAWILGNLDSKMREIAVTMCRFDSATR